MTLVTWFFLMLALLCFMAALYACNRKAKAEDANRYLRRLLHQEHNKVLQYQQIVGIMDGKHTEFFDFEKVNGKKEK